MVTAKKKPVDRRDFDTMRDRAEVAEAREQRALELLRGLAKRIRRIGGHSTPEEQHALWAAEALIAESVEVRR